MGRESREFLLKPITQQLNCKLFAFKMSDISNQDFPVGIEKLVILEVGRHKNIGTGCNCIGQQKTAASSANSNTTNDWFYSFGMSHHCCFHIRLEQLKKGIDIDFFRQLSYHAAANIL